MEIPIDLISAISGGIDVVYRKPAMSLRLNKAQVQKYGAYHPTGGVLEVGSSIPASGGLDFSSVGVRNFDMDHLVKIPNAVVVLKKVQEVFLLTKEQLAQICGCTRKTLYNWKDGTSEPRRKALKRLFKLSMIVDAWKDNGLSIFGDDLFAPVIGSDSLFDMLVTESLDEEKILFAGSRLQMGSAISGKVLEDPFAL